MIAVEGLGDADFAEHLAGAADLARLRVFEHEHVKVVGLAVLLALEALLATGELGDQGRAVGAEGW